MLGIEKNNLSREEKFKYKEDANTKNFKTLGMI